MPWGIRLFNFYTSGTSVVMYYTPGHLCPGCVVHHYSQFYGLERGDSMDHIFCTILWKKNQFIVQMHGPNECH